MAKLNRESNNELTLFAGVHTSKDLVEDVERPLIRSLMYCSGFLQEILKCSVKGRNLIQYIHKQFTCAVIHTITIVTLVKRDTGIDVGSCNEPTLVKVDPYELALE